MKRSQSHCNMMLCFSLMLALLFVVFPQSSSLAETKPHPSQRWEKTIQRFEKQDRQQLPVKHGVLFVGSSSIRLWDLKKSFPEHSFINRGFGGSEIVDSTYFAERIILNHQPKLILLYAGDNDVSRGKSAEQVFADYQNFVKTVHAKLPKTRIVYIAIKPSIARWKLIDTIRKANGLIETGCQKNDLLEYADIVTPMIGEDGKPKPNLFIKDGLHLNEEGYKLWTKIVTPFIQQTLKQKSSEKSPLKSAS